MQIFIKNLKNNTPQDNQNFEETLNSKHIFTNNIEELRYNVNLFNILKTQTEPMEIFNSPGHIIIDLYNNYQCVCFYRDKVERIRIEKFEGDAFKTLLEVYNEDFDKIPDCNIYEILQEKSS